MELGCESRGFRQIAYPRDRSIVGSFFIRESYFGYGAKHAVIGITGQNGDAAMMPCMKPVNGFASIAFVMTKAACYVLASIAFVFTRRMRAIVLASMGFVSPNPLVEASPKPLCRQAGG